MTHKIVNLFPAKTIGNKPEPVVIALLEDLLAQAKTGDLQSIAFASQHGDGSIQTGFTPGQDIFSMIGAVRLVETRLLECIDE